MSAPASRSLSPEYATSTLPRPLVAVDVVAFALRDGALSTILVRRGLAPFAGKWALPGGFVLPKEALEVAARRELTEETGAHIRSSYVEQLYTFGDPRRDPRGRVISVTYLALLAASDDVHLRGGSDAADAQWWPVAALPHLAFDHDAIIAYAVQRLRYKLEYTNIMFALLPDRFTFGELQSSYEWILGKPFDKRNFRKKIGTLGFVRPTSEWRRPEQGRPARLWRFDRRELVQVKTFVAKATH